MKESDGVMIRNNWNFCGSARITEKNTVEKDPIGATPRAAHERETPANARVLVKGGILIE